MSAALAHGTMGLVVVAAAAATRFLFPRLAGVGKQTRRESLIFFWYAFDLLTHWTIELWFVLMALWPGGTRAWKDSFISLTWAEYARADKRWWHADGREVDVNIVAVEAITVVGAGALLVALMYLMISNGDKVTRHFLNIVLCTAEIYGGWMTFAPEWFSGNLNLAPISDVYLNWLLLWLANGIWVVVPLILLRDSFIQLKKETGSIAHRKGARLHSPRKRA